MRNDIDAGIFSHTLNISVYIFIHARLHPGQMPFHQSGNLILFVLHYTVVIISNCPQNSCKLPTQTHNMRPLTMQKMQGKLSKSQMSQGQFKSTFARNVTVCIRSAFVPGLCIFSANFFMVRTLDKHKLYEKCMGSQAGHECLLNAHRHFTCKSAFVRHKVLEKKLH